MTTTKSKMANATARKHYLHDCDRDEAGRDTCYFSRCGYDGGEGGWGFWVDRDGKVTADEVSASGELPSRQIVAACVRSAVKYLSR